MTIRQLAASLAVVVSGLLPAAASVRAQVTDTASVRIDSVFVPAPHPDALPAGAPIALTVDEAVALAVDQAYAVRIAELDVRNANAQIRSAWGQLYPRAEGSANYTRSVVSANPFAGSGAGGLFGSLGAIDWLAYNEDARTDDDPETEPLTLEEFRDRQQAGYDAAGYAPDPGANPFGVDNQFNGTVAISQTLYSGTAFAAVRGARTLREFNEAGLDARRADAAHDARRLFYTALLAQERVSVLRASVARAEETAREAALLVAQGVRPALERLQAEVALANLEAQATQAAAGAGTAADQLLFAIGLPVGQPVVLRGELEPPADAGRFRVVGLVDAIAVARRERPDLRQARLAVRLREVDRNISRAAYLPTLSAFANLGYAGTVPDDRTFLTQTGDFTYETGSLGFFDGSYWNPSVAVGLSLQWTLFDGFQRRYTLQQREIAIDQTEIQLAQAEEAAALEVSAALREMENAERRVTVAGRTVEQAETAYRYAIERLRQGIGPQFDVRTASDQLDQARLNYLQAVYDLLVARSALERATGTTVPVVTP